MITLIKYFNCGKIFNDRNAFYFKVTKFYDIVYKIIPLLKKYPIRGSEGLIFYRFCLVAEMMKNKKHLTKEGLEQIRKIKAGMNRGRFND